MTRPRIWLLFVSGATSKLMEILKTERAALIARHNSGNLVLCASSQSRKRTKQIERPRKHLRLPSGEPNGTTSLTRLEMCTQARTSLCYR